MRAIYFDDTDTLVLHFSDSPIVRESSNNWNVHGSYDANGNIVQLVLVEASTLMPSLFQIARKVHLHNIRKQAGTRPKPITSQENGKKGGRPKKIKQNV
jgi:uncharacterized protein YuzE